MAKQKIYPDGSKSFILHVTADFEDSDLLSVIPSAIIRRRWKAGGMILVSSKDDDFKDQIEAAYIETVLSCIRDKDVSPDYVSALENRDSACCNATNVLWGVFDPPLDDDKWSAFDQNYQWALLQVNAVNLRQPGQNGGQWDPNANNGTGGYVAQDKWDAPSWKLYVDKDKNDDEDMGTGVPLEGRGVVVGVWSTLPTWVDSGTRQQTLHPEFSWYREFDPTDPWGVTADFEEEVAPESFFTEDPAADEVHLLGGMLGYDPTTYPSSSGTGVEVSDTVDVKTGTADIVSFVTGDTDDLIDFDVAVPGTFKNSDIGKLATITGATEPTFNGTWLLFSVGNSGTRMTLVIPGGGVFGGGIIEEDVNWSIPEDNVQTATITDGDAIGADVSKGHQITIAGMTNADNNGTFTILQVLSETQVNYVNNNAGAANEVAAGATWSIARIVPAQKDFLANFRDRWFNAEDVIVANFLSQMFARGVGLKTKADGTPFDPTDGTIATPGVNFGQQPVAGGHFPEKDGVSKIAAYAGGTAQENHKALGPFTALQGRMRGMIPCAKCICYNELPVFTPGPAGALPNQNTTTIYLSSKLLGLEAAVRHNVQIWVDSWSLVLPNEDAAEFKDLVASAWEPFKTGDIIYVSPTQHWGAITGKKLSSYSQLFGDIHNTLYVGGVGPRSYNPQDCCLNEYDPGQYSNPPAKEKNLCRPVTAGHPYAIFGGFLAGIFLGHGSGLSFDRDVVGPQGSTDMYDLAEELTNFFGFTNATSLYNSYIYGASVFPGSIGENSQTTFFVDNWDIPVVPNIGNHGGHAGACTPAAFVAAICALYMENKKATTGSFPNLRKVVNMVRRTARDGKGPESDDMVFTYTVGNHYIETQILAKADPPPVEILFCADLNPAPPSGCQNIDPWNFFINHPLKLHDTPARLMPGPGPLVWRTMYLQDFPADKPGKDLLMGKGVVDATEAIRAN